MAFIAHSSHDKLLCDYYHTLTYKYYRKDCLYISVSSTPPPSWNTSLLFDPTEG